MMIGKKLFFPIFVIFPFSFVFLLNSGIEIKRDMEKNKKELLLQLEKVFGCSQKTKDFSKNYGYAFWYFPSEYKQEYKDRLLSIGLKEIEGGFCYKGALLEYQDDYYLSFKYIYPDDKCS